MGLVFQDPNKGQTTTLFPVETSLSKAHVIKNKIKKKKKNLFWHVQCFRVAVTLPQIANQSFKVRLYQKNVAMSFCILVIF